MLCFIYPPLAPKKEIVYVELVMGAPRPWAQPVLWI
jgi:hypothetical protein